MSEVLNRIRKELFKLSEIEFDHEEKNSLLAMQEFIENISYLRKCPEEELINHFSRILFLDKEESIKFIFFIRDIKNGLGERRIFRVIINFLAKEHPGTIENNIRIIPKYGRWDDLYALFDTPLEEKVIYLIKNQIQKDLSSRNPSTLGKWLKSENTSSKESRALAYKTRMLLNYSSKEYRKLLSTLRKKLNIIESNLSSREYNRINYDNISRLSMTKYKKALFRNDKENYHNFLKDNFNSEYIYPNKLLTYLKNDIDKDKLNKNIEKLLFDIIIKDTEILEDSFIINGLDENENYESLSLLIFTIVLYKKINLNAFKNYYMSFKKNPKFNKLSESSTVNNIRAIYNNDTNFNIELDSALDLLLFTLLKKNLSIESEPKSILYIYNNNEDIGFYISEELEEKWLKAGFNIPKIKLWNLKNLNEDFSIKYIDNVIRISGYNKNIWPYLLNSKEISNSKIILDKYNKMTFKDIII